MGIGTKAVVAIYFLSLGAWGLVGEHARGKARPCVPARQRHEVRMHLGTRGGGAGGVGGGRVGLIERGMIGCTDVGCQFSGGKTVLLWLRVNVQAEVLTE